MISVVIPVYNEADSLRDLHREIDEVASANQLDVEVVFVDDGSTDGSWPRIRALAERHAGVRGIRFRRNFGKAAALSAGFKTARGEIILTLDADLQDDPAEIPRFLSAIGYRVSDVARPESSKGVADVEPTPVEDFARATADSRLDVVSGWKKVRRDPWHKVVPSRVFNFLVSWLTGVKLHDHNCGMKCYRAEVFREVRLYGELHRFIPVLAHARGFKVGEIVINHRPRKFGRSKYGVRRFVKGFLDLLTVKFLTGFGGRPQHLLGTIGMLSFGLGVLGLIYLATIWVLTNFFGHDFEPLHRRPLLIYSAAALILGAQMMSIGFLAELITAYQSRDEDAYSVSERTPPNDPCPENDQ